MDKVFGEKLILPTQLHTKDDILMIRSMATESINGAQAVIIKAIFTMIKEMDMEKCTGSMEAHIKANGRKEPKEGKE